MVGKPKSAEMYAGAGFRICTEISRPPRELVKAFAEFDTPEVSDFMNRLYTMTSAIHSMTPGGALPLVGPACTVKVFPGDNLMVHKCLDVAEPGDVVVIHSSSSTAVLGDLISTKARHRGIAGFVVDGLIRDLPDIEAMGDFPVFARGATPIGPLHRGPGEINYPISAGNIVVYPGDIIVGDGNGVVVVPQGIATELLERLTNRREASRAYSEAVGRGDFSNEWVDAILEEGGVSYGAVGAADPAKPPQSE
jgi:regulator of RNase E activity RraA